MSQHWTEEQYQAYLSRMKPHVPKTVEPVPMRVSSRAMNETERRYNIERLGGKGRYESLTIILPGNVRYTPDFATVDDGVLTLHEVKGSYRLGSQGRAYAAFHEAAAAWPCWRFVWAEERKGGGWKVATLQPSASPVGREKCGVKATGDCVTGASAKALG